jgi:hypothetical protein
MMHRNNAIGKVAYYQISLVKEKQIIDLVIGKGEECRTTKKSTWEKEGNT